MQLIWCIVAVYILQAHSQDKLIRYSIYICNAIVFLRMNAMMFIWLPRGIGWTEAIGNSLAFALYYIGFPLFSIYASRTMFIPYVAGCLLFLIGGAINTSAELIRKPFKDNPANRGKLYTGGLFKYAIHINYFGDLLWVLGFALVTGNVFALVVPVFLLASFVCSYIPAADKYLLNKYGKAFEAYRKTTAELIPYIW
ncbi:MAG: DUF1295 domain-containing protein [Tannerella sp.]|nr:DUF1295 domain-containing protein [Tannerella sp.]